MSLLALKEYITGAKRARFSSFVSKNKKRIPEWSIKMNSTSAHGLFGVCVNEYDNVHSKIKSTEKSSPRPRLSNSALWNEIFESFQQHKNAVDASLEEAISTLTIAPRPAGQEVRKLIDPVAPNAEDDVDTYLDVPFEGLPSTSGNSPKTRLSLQLRAPGRDRFQVDGVDISEEFYRMQQYVFNFVISNNLTLESDVHLILSLSSILLLQNNNRLHEAMVPFFGNRLYTRIREHNLASWKSTSNFPGQILLKTIEISQSMYDKTIDRISASASVLNLTSTMEDNIDERLIMSASWILQSLPMDPTNTDISETTLIVRYIVPLLEPLFDNDDLNIQLNFTGSELAEKYKRPPQFNGCPDCIITCFPHQTDNGINVGYGEVKKHSMANNHYLTNWDLVRLAFFGKNAIDDNNLGGNISIHIVERNSDADTSSWRRESLTTNDIVFLLEKKKNRKRKNTTGY
ncbi:hypothetical protein CLU79DRAFT_722191 [Phycomyces nitens]|nr:hypothetical protein CLU79DRAFT_722191 [Phycomyces nitens]